MILKWRAICPTCGHRISRRGILSETITCPGCGGRLKQNEIWNRNAMIAAAAVGLLGGAILVAATRRLGTRPLLITGAVFVVALLIAAAWAWPYGTKYDLAEVPGAGAGAGASNPPKPPDGTPQS